MKRQFIFRHRDLAVGAESFDLEVAPTNFSINKPLQAVWSSSLIEFNNQLPETGWSQWCKAEDYCNIEEAKVFELKFKEEPKLVVVDTDEDLMKLNNIGLLSIDTEYYRYSSLVKHGIINYKAILDKGYDGIRVTKNAIVESKVLQLIDVLPSSIYVDFSAWDCESTCWVTNRCFKEYKYLGIYSDLVG